MSVKFPWSCEANPLARRNFDVQESHAVTNSPSAFVSLDERAHALSPDQILDRISVRDHIVDVEIGAFEVERGFTQRVSFNIVVELTPFPKDLGDDVDRILSYDTLTDAVKTELAAERLALLETLCERIADRILLEPQALRVFVRVEKLDRGPGALGVEIVRTIEDLSADGAEQPTASKDVQPVIVHMSAAALAEASLPQWLDAFSASEKPIIVTHALPKTRAFDVGDAQTAQTAGAQRRIDLLTLEQVAWQMAVLDARCTVRATRTELDWAMKQNLISIWAPSKMVLDAVDGPTGDALALAAWLAEDINASELIVLGEDLPEGCNIAARRLDPAGAIALF
jgi:dihydroneopterin aldolase